MRILFHRDFRKSYKKLRQNERRKADDRIRLFETDMSHPLLNNHELHNPYEGCRSINVTGDIRAVYEQIGSDIMHFIALGTHSELYE
jgi:addiction module RelE/StbE family toxin